MLDDDTIEFFDDPRRPTRELRWAEDLLDVSRGLLHELEQFKTYLQERRKENTVELRTFRGNVRAELKSIERVFPSFTIPMRT